MSVEILISETAWRLRAYLGSSVDEQRASLEEAFAALFAAEHIAARHQLPARATCQRCAYIAPWGTHCQQAACTPELFGFLTTSPDQRPEELACWPFYGRLCTRHERHLVVPLASWWPPASEALEAIHAAI